MATAQVPIGIPDFGTYDAEGVIKTNLADLTKHVDMLLRSSNARNFSLPIDLAFDESFSIGNSNTQYFAYGTWQLGSTIITKLDDRRSSTNCSGQQDATHTISGAWDGHNTYHSLGLLPIVISQNGCPNNPSGYGTSTDGWSFSASVSGSGQLTYSLVDLNGYSHASASSVQDPNGNVAQLSGSSYLDAGGNTFLTQSGGLPPTTTYSTDGTFPQFAETRSSVR